MVLGKVSCFRMANIRLDCSLNTAEICAFNEGFECVTSLVF